MKVLGVLLMIFGFVDLIASFGKFGLWEQYMGIELPISLWKSSAYIELILGYSLLLTGGKLAPKG